MSTHRVTAPRACLVGLLGAVLLFASAPAFAARNSSPVSTSWISLEQPAGAGAALAPWEPGLGDLVTFATGAPRTVKNPQIAVQCYQDGVLVYGEAGFADQGIQQDLTGYPGFVLGGSSSPWLTAGGAAACNGILYYYGSLKGQQTYNVLATTSFPAAG